MKLYRYLPAEFAVMAIENRCLKVGRLAELNDPFDCYPRLPISDPAAIDIELHTNSIVNEYSRDYGILSFSRNISDPVIWSHYAEDHKGIVLVFNCEDSHQLHEVVYQIDRPRFTLAELGALEQLEAGRISLPTIAKIFSTKALSWNYEQEYRLFIDLETCRPQGGLYLYDTSDLELVEVILGARSVIDSSYIQHTLTSNGYEGVSVLKALRSPDSYEILTKLTKNT